MIYGLARRCGIDNDLLHDMIKHQFQAESMKALSMGQGKLLIDRLQKATGDASAEVPGRASEGQRRMIYGLARELGWSRDSKRLRGFLEKRFDVSDVPFLPAAKCGPVIEALKAIRDGGRGERRLENG
jgi:hypothetical protein